MAYGEVSRGFADIKLYVLTGVADTPGTGIDVPGGRALSWQSDQDTEDWEGDDIVQATSADNKTGSGSLAVARANGTAMAAYLGGTAAVTGTTPAQVITHNEDAEANDIYVMIKAQASGKDTAGSAYRVTLFKAKVFSPAESMQLKQYNEPTSDIRFIPNSAGAYVQREWYETGIVIPTTLP